MKILPPTALDHRRITAFLRTRDIEFHSYSLPEDQVLTVVVGGLPTSTNPADVLSALKATGLPAREAHRIFRRDKQPTRFIRVVLDKTPEGKEIFNIKSLMYCDRITIEVPYKSGTPSQCHRCQRYGHSARNCYNRPRCVKCLGNHGTDACPRPKDPRPDDLPGCVLCGEVGHPASYRGCPKAPRLPAAARSASRPKPSPATRAPAPSALSKITLRPAAPLPPPRNPWVKPGVEQPAKAVQPTVAAPASAPAPAPDAVVEDAPPVSASAQPPRQTQPANAPAPAKRSQPPKPLALKAKRPKAVKPVKSKAPKATEKPLKSSSSNGKGLKPAALPVSFSRSPPDSEQEISIADMALFMQFVALTRHNNEIALIIRKIKAINSGPDRYTALAAVLFEHQSLADSVHALLDSIPRS